ncbi:MAG: hypothetical protein U5J83_13160 [Bryobacterales bacterium]|nr:hypothetical protein [Bryobacterales bacterium]
MGGFGHGQELAGRNEAAVAMPPAQQGLDAGDGKVVEGDLWLQDSSNFIVFERQGDLLQGGRAAGNPPPERRVKPPARPGLPALSTMPPVAGK